MSDTKILHNDTCPICSREVAGYDRLARKHGVDITIDGLDQAQHWGLDADQAAREFRVLHHGTLYTGMDAFRVLWAKLPYWRVLGWVTGVPVIRQITDLGYDYLAAPLLYAMHKRRIQRASR